MDLVKRYWLILAIGAVAVWYLFLRDSTSSTSAPGPALVPRYPWDTANTTGDMGPPSGTTTTTSGTTTTTPAGDVVPPPLPLPPAAPSAIPFAYFNTFSGGSMVPRSFGGLSSRGGFGA